MLLGIFFFLSPDIHELSRSVMSVCLFIEVKQYWATLVLGWLCARSSRPKPLSALLPVPFQRYIVNLVPNCKNPG